MLAQTITDRNGNQITLSGQSSYEGGSLTQAALAAGYYQDTVGRHVISWTGLGNSSGDQITVSGLPGDIAIKWINNNFSFWGKRTFFSGTANGPECHFSPGTQTAVLPTVSEIDLPNGQKYSFVYGGTYGRLTKIIFPGGGYVRYVWGINANSSAAQIQYADFYGNHQNCYYTSDALAITDRYVSYDGSTEVLHQNFSYTPTSWSTLTDGAPNWPSKQTVVTATDLVTNQTTITSYTYGSVIQQVVTLSCSGDCAGNTSFPALNPQIPVETQIKYEDGSQNILRTVNKTWFDQYGMIGEQTILDNGQGMATVRCLDGNDRVLANYEYGFQSEGSKPADPPCSILPNAPATPPGGTLSYGLNTSAMGPLDRYTITAYQTFGSTNILTAPSSVSIYSGSGTLASQANYAYDQNTLQASGAINLVNPSAARANATTVQHLITGSSYATTTYSYYDTGQLYTMTDPCGNSTCSDMTGSNHTTTYHYADNYASGTGSPTGQTSAYLTSVTFPNTGVAHTESFSWGYNDGQLRTTTDQNNQLTAYKYGTQPTVCPYADQLDRLTEIDYPNQGQTLVCYNDSLYSSATPSPSFTTFRLTTSTNGVKQYLELLTASDGLGHKTETLRNGSPASDPDCAGGDRIDTSYDGFGRVHTVSNAYCLATDTVRLTTYAYDPLGRAISLTHPDSTTVLTSYAGRATQVQDEGNGTQRITRISQTDALGRLSSVCEVAGAPFVGPGGASSSSLIGQNGSPGACGQDIVGNGFLTSYNYDVLGNLLGVTQGTMTSRSFSYDSLSRLTNAANPESGAISYAYDANSNLSTKTAPAPNQTGTSTVSTTYQYDALDRLTSKSYSDGTTPTATFYYDKDPAGRSYTNIIGRLFESTVPSQLGLCCITTFQEYDPMGRISIQSQYLPTGCACDFGVPYTYDLMGNMLTSEDPYGNVFTYGYNTGGRVVSVTGSYSDSDDPANLLSATKYNAAGQPVSDALGDGETETFTYDTRLRLQAASSVFGSTPVYSYSLTFAPNSNVLTANDSVNGNWNYSYDQFNRLVCASLSSNTACAMPPTGTPTYTYVYDRFGNRWQQDSPAGNIYTSSFTFTGNGGNNTNRMDGYSYDSAGNLLFDGTHHYFYDAENHLIQVDGTLPYCTSNGASGFAGTACYYYDAAGHRVFRTGYTADTCDSTGKRGYVFDLAGHVIVETNANDTGCVSQVYLGERHFGRQGGGSFFYHSDWLGTVRYVNADLYPTDPNETCTSLPFGDGLTCSSTRWDVWHFTGKERDYESGLDNFGARYDASSMGRFMSPDWSASPSPVPYASLPYPQSLNLYAYVQNNPLSHTDPNGHCDVDGEHHNWVWCAAHSLGLKETKKETAAREKNEAEVAEFLRAHPQYLQNALLMAASLGTMLAVEATNMGAGESDSTVPAEEQAAIEAGAAGGAGAARTIINGVPQPSPEGEIVVAPNGVAVKIPAGYVAEPAANGNGIVYRLAGSTGNANTIRIMGPDARGLQPNGYVRVYNSSGQPIIPSTGKPGTQAQTHTPF